MYWLDFLRIQLLFPCNYFSTSSISDIFGCGLKAKSKRSPISQSLYLFFLIILNQILIHCFYSFSAAAFFFHACLLLVLFRWRPSKDDSALFYVIAAAWGACNGIWETLIYALMTLTHTNHIMKVAAPLQSCRFLGLGITFLLHTFICEYHKILILVVLLAICLPPYAVLEVRLEAQRKSQSTSMWRTVFS